MAITYCSIATVDFEPESIDILVERAAFHNKKVGITGYLYYSNGHFVQYIEGMTPDVTALMQRIEDDKRHHITNIAYDCSLDHRRFYNWSLKKLTNANLVEIDLESTWEDLMHWSRCNCEQNAEKKIWQIMGKTSGYYQKFTS